MVEMRKRYKTIGVDISPTKVSSIRQDPEFQWQPHSHTLVVTTDPTTIAEADVIIIAVPTPVNDDNTPNLTPLIQASEIVGAFMKHGAIVVYESTVYPGATEDVCVPVLEKASGKRWKTGFNVAYSPERINPGDSEHTIVSVTKIVAGDTRQTLDKIDELYSTIIPAGTYRASSIRVAEMAKVMENTQRDVNIALVNEMAILCDKLGINTADVIDAASTKWNALNFKPGLVGGHCVGVDPYYLLHKAGTVGYTPRTITAAREVNEGMAHYIATKTISEMVKHGGVRGGDVVAILGLSFKENCPDIRNTKVADIVHILKSHDLAVVGHDPYVSTSDAVRECELAPYTDRMLMKNYNAVIIAVAHADYYMWTLVDFLRLLKPGGVIIDVKRVLDTNLVHTIRKHGYGVWQL
jgi:UDP-N-acetyl-D-galactosamine dehydrogenase